MKRSISLFNLLLKWSFFLASVVMILIMIPPSRADSVQTAKRVLFISSYTENYEAVPLQLDSIQKVLTPQGINLDVEYMDTKRINTKKNIELFYSMLKYKLSIVAPYDALIVGDDSALQFAMDYQSDLFPNLPIIYFGINDIDRALIAGENPFITGIIEETSLKENIELALKFNPTATRIVAVVDNTNTGIGDKNQFYMNEASFPNLKFETIVASDFTFEEIAEKLEAIDNDTILFYLSMYSDESGAYITVTEAAAFFKQHSRVPVYRATVGGVGKGILGGKMVSFTESGKMAAEMVLKVFSGTPIEEIEVITESPNYYVLDYELLQQYDIDMSLVPEGTTFINRKVSFYEQYKQLVWIVLSIISVLTLFSILMIWDNLKRRAIEKDLKESHEELSQTYEELAATEEELREQNIKLQQNSDKIRLLNEKYELSINSTNSVVWELNTVTDELYFSGNIQAVTGLDIKEYENVDDFFRKLPDKELKVLILEEFKKYLHNEKSEISLQLSIRMKDNSLRWYFIRGKGIDEEDASVLHGILLDITKMKEQEKYIEHLARHDYLTDLPNRYSFMDKLKEELEKKLPLSIIMLDIDNFKAINDTQGHVHGDLLLKNIADRIVTLQSDKVYAFRFGGDEFLVLILDDSSQKVIEKYIRKLQDTFKKPFHIGGREHYIEFSMGISRYPIDSEDLHQLMMHADAAMYRVKHTGKNSYLFYNDEMQEAMRERAGIEAILRRALNEDGFYLVYQPIINVKTGEIHAFEALLRLKNHKLPPNIFIKVAEESDFILEIGRNVTKEAIAQLAAWSKKGYPLKCVSINFSSKQLRDLDYIHFLKATLEKYEVDPKYLVIEITESILLDETDYTIEFLYSLRELGVKIALDDFGTGYSSINYLTYIPVDHVKLDKSLCDKFLQLDNIGVMDSIISLSHSLSLQITAEGIEEQAQYERLKAGGCDYIQGYYFSKPLPIEEIDKIYYKVYQ